MRYGYLVVMMMRSRMGMVCSGGKHTLDKKRCSQGEDRRLWAFFCERIACSYLRSYPRCIPLVAGARDNLSGPFPAHKSARRFNTSCAISTRPVANLLDELTNYTQAYNDQILQLCCRITSCCAILGIISIQVPVRVSWGALFEEGMEAMLPKNLSRSSLDVHSAPPICQ